MKIRTSTFDIVVLTSSLICAVHCAAVPILLSFSSLSSLHFLHNPLIEWTFIGIGVVFVFVSLWPSYRKKHRRARPLLIAAAGFILIAISRLDFGETWETVNTVSGALLVSMAHFINWKMLRHACRHKL